MKCLNYILPLFFLYAFVGVSQNMGKDEQLLTAIRQIPAEKIYVHTNNTTLLTGEYLFYKVYCFNTKTQAPSDLSKIAYVELLGPNGTIVFKQKIRLNQGMGYGEFFIPVNVVSANYKLLGYTRWMLNNERALFNEDILIINPYQSDQSQVLRQDSKNDSIFVSHTDISPVLESPRPKNNALVQMSLPNTSFGQRERVSVRLTNQSEDIYNCSVSVYKKDGLQIPKTSSLSTINENPNPAPTASNVILPELRGELMEGILEPLQNNAPLNNVEVALSIPGEEFYFTLSSTNEKGVFYANIDEQYSGDRIFTEVLGTNKNAYKTTIVPSPSPKYEHLTFSSYTIDRSAQKAIVRRSIANQVQNAYFNFRPDSILQKSGSSLFERKEHTKYELNDYTRFATLKETFYEIIKDVKVKRTGGNNETVRVQGYDFDTDSGFAPLLLIDGLLVQDHAQFLNYPATLVESIKVYRDLFVIGTQLYQGALLLQSRNLDDSSFLEVSVTDNHALFKPEIEKNYYTQRYAQSEIPSPMDKMPDYRQQLVWMPNLEITKGVNVLDFYTSDISGDYIIEVEGVSTSGQIFSKQAVFKVSDKFNR